MKCEKIFDSAYRTLFDVKILILDVILTEKAVNI